MNQVEFTLAYPWMLTTLLLLPLVIILRFFKKIDLMPVPHAASWLPHGRNFATPVWTAIVLYLALALLIISAARPQRSTVENPTEKQGYDIMLVIDLSGSMLAEDAFKNGQRINRLRAILPVIQRFVRNRRNDRIGVVVFAGRAYTLSNLTMQHDWLEEQIGRLGVEQLEDGTAIGDALGIAVSRLEQKERLMEGQRPGAFIVLLTDGANNSGHLQPLQAASLAVRRAIPVFTIAVGREGVVPYPVFDRAGRIRGYENMISEIDFVTMKKIAQLTGGKFFHAEDAGAADAVFAEIDKAKPIRFTSEKRKTTTEEFQLFAVPGFLLLYLGYFLNTARFRQIREMAA